MSARENILARIRTAQGRPGTEPSETELREVRAQIGQHTSGPQPAIAHAPDPLAQFRLECDRVSTTNSEAAGMVEVPRAVARYLEANTLEPRIVVWPEFSSLDWSGAGIVAEARPAHGQDRTGVTGCFCAIAETGTVLLLSSPQTPKLNALLPENHICVVRRPRLVDTMEEAFALLRTEVGELPRSVFFVSGPSRTADIEQTIVIGAHGPYREHVIVVP
jgi:L-lactate dehydrogenase complex protein LldG